MPSSSAAVPDPPYFSRVERVREVRPPRVQSGAETFAQWLHAPRLAGFVSTYQHDQLLALSAETPRQLRLSAYHFDRPMGIAASRHVLSLATRQHVWRFEQLNPIQASPRGDSCFALVQFMETGYLDAHDLIDLGHGKSVLVDTHHSCLRALRKDTSPEPIWQPPFISELVPEDRCHLNGAAAVGDTPRYATLVSQTDTQEGWRQEREGGGVLSDIASNEVVCQNLTMPHSPRVHRDRIWVLNAGNGEFGFIEPHTGAFQAIAFCPGFSRGLAFHEDFAIVGLSKARHQRKFSDLPLGKTLKARSREAICGLQVINIESQQSAIELEFDAPLEELFDVQVVPGLGHPRLLERGWS